VRVCVCFGFYLADILISFVSYEITHEQFQNKLYFLSYLVNWKYSTVAIEKW